MKKALDILYVIYQYCIALPILIAYTLLTALTVMFGCLIGSKDFWGYWPGVIWGRLFCWLLFIPVQINGLENLEKGKAYVIIPNHQSFYDCFVLYGWLGRPFKWLMKKELMSIPVVGTACRICGHIAIDRDSRASGKKGLEQAAAAIKRGVSMIIFPEGTRTPDGNVARFKRGAFVLSQQLQAELLPVTIDGAYQVMSKSDVRVHRHPLKVTFHKPMMPPASGGLDDHEKAAEIRRVSDMASAVIASGLGNQPTVG